MFAAPGTTSKSMCLSTKNAQALSLQPDVPIEQCLPPESRVSVQVSAAVF